MENENLNNNQLGGVPNNQDIETGELNGLNSSQTPETKPNENADKPNIDNGTDFDKNLEQVAEQPKPMNEVERLSQYYNTKQEKTRVNAIIMMTLSMIAMIASIVVGLYITVNFVISVLGIDGSKFFDQATNTVSFGIAGLSGAILYIVSGAVVLLLVGLTYYVARSYFKLFKNLKRTKQQPYYIVAYNGTIKVSFLINLVYLIAFVTIVVINFQNKFNGVIPILLIVLASLSAVVAIDALVEIIIARIKFSKHPDEKLKLEVKREAHDRFKLYLTNRGRDIERAKNRKRWF